nr:hypothetical protein [Tanacetum cinerariifolium]
MSSPTHPIIILSNSEIKDAFSSTNTHDYIPISPDYSPASLGNTSSDSSKDLSKDLLASLAILPFHDDLYMKVMEAYNDTNNESPIPPPRAPIASPTVLPPSLIGESYHVTRLERHEEQIDVILNHLDKLPLKRIEYMEDKIEGLGYSCIISYVSGITMALLPPCFLKPLYLDMINAQDIEHMIPPTPPRDTEPPVGSPIPLSPSSSVGSSSPVRSTTPPPDYPFDESILVELDNSMAPKRTSTSVAPAMTQAAIKKLVADTIATALEAQAAIMANTDNTNRNIGQRETPVARKCSYKEFMSCQPFNFKDTVEVLY